MENAVDALYIAGAVLLLLIALTIGISSFSSQVSQIDEIVQADERVDIVTETSGDYVNYISHSDSERVVSVDTIVNTLYRAYKENNTVYINVNIDKTTLEDYGINVVDTTNSSINGQALKRNYYAVFKITTEYNLQNAKERLNQIFYGTTGNNGFYNAIRNKRFKEFIGELYQDDIITNPSESYSSDVSDANRTKVRIITYVEI